DGRGQRIERDVRPRRERQVLQRLQHPVGPAVELRRTREHGRAGLERRVDVRQRRLQRGGRGLEATAEDREVDQERLLEAQRVGRDVERRRRLLNRRLQ